MRIWCPGRFPTDLSQSRFFNCQSHSRKTELKRRLYLLYETSEAQTLSVWGLCADVSIKRLCLHGAFQVYKGNRENYFKGTASCQAIQSLLKLILACWWIPWGLWEDVLTTANEQWSSMDCHKSTYYCFPHTLRRLEAATSSVFLMCLKKLM